jgi:hydrogenase maturation protease
MDAQQPHIAVLGLGNVLMGDDGLGPYVVASLLARRVLPPEVRVQDAGTPGGDLIPMIAGLEALIVVDTVRSAGAPGELRLYRREQLLAHPPGPSMTPHDPGLAHALLTLELWGQAPREVLLVGVIPGPVRPVPGLSEPVRRAAARAEAEVLRELARLGFAAHRRTPELEPDVWWEREAEPCTS